MLIQILSASTLGLVIGESVSITLAFSISKFLISQLIEVASGLLDIPRNRHRRTLDQAPIANQLI